MKDALPSPTAAALSVRRLRDRRRRQGLVKKEVWILPEHGPALAALEKGWREPSAASSTSQRPPAWTVPALDAALRASPAAQAGDLEVEKLAGASPSLRVRLRDRGGVEVLVVVVGERLVMEAYLWPVSAVRDSAAFHERVLRTQQALPLSTVSLTEVAGKPAYTLVGALDAQSDLGSVWLELGTLADNVLAAVGLYADCLLSEAFEEGEEP